jgi:hypothetical protein
LKVSPRYFTKKEKKMKHSEKETLVTIMAGVLGSKYNQKKYGTRAISLARSCAYLLVDEKISVYEVIDCLVKALDEVDEAE